MVNGIGSGDNSSGGYVNVTAPPTHAAGPWYVGPGGNDGNNCTSQSTRCATINGALGKAGFVAGDTIQVQVGTYTGNGNEVVLLNKNATLSGGWNSTFTTQNGMSTIDGQGARRGVTVNGGVTATVERFVVQNGSVSGGGGGGICNLGSLILDNTTISDNTAITSVSSSDCNQASNGGGIYNTNTGTLALNDSIVSSNNVDCNGSGIYNEGDFTSEGSIIRENTAGGFYCVGMAVMNASGVMTLSNSIVNNNMPGGGIFNHYYGTLILNSSTISGNTSDDWNGGGITNWDSSLLTLNNSTISGNTTGTGKGGGIYNGANGTVILNNSTVSSNTSSGDGGGIYSSSGSVTLQNTLLAGNTTSTTGPDCNGTIGSSGYNLVGDTSGCTFASTTGDLTNVDPKLGPLQDNDGPTKTHALLSGSPAINAGNPAGCTDNIGSPLPFDQRGMPRLGRCDIGAYEAGLAATKQGEGTFGPSGLVTYTITISNEEAITDLTNVSVSDTLPIYHTYVPGSFSATNGTGGESNGIVSWNGAVSAATDTVINFAATISDSVPQSIIITNTAVISSGGVSITRHASFDTFPRIYLPILFGCPRLYFDDFNNPASGWPIGDNGNIRREYLNGEYRTLVRQPGWVALMRPFSNNTPDFKGDNYIVAVDARNDTGVSATLGLLFEVSDNFSQFYTFEVFPNGTYEIWRVNFVSGSTMLASGSSSSINTGTASNRLKVERNGSMIRAYANGQLVRSISDGTYTGQRQVGLVVYSRNQSNMDGRFDNFTVYPVSCGVAATAIGQASESSETGEGVPEINLPDGWANDPNQK